MDDLKKVRINTSSMMLRRRNEGDVGMVYRGTWSEDDINYICTFDVSAQEVKEIMDAGRTVAFIYPEHIPSESPETTHLVLSAGDTYANVFSTDSIFSLLIEDSSTGKLRAQWPKDE